MVTGRGRGPLRKGRCGLRDFNRSVVPHPEREAFYNSGGRGLFSRNHDTIHKTALPSSSLASGKWQVASGK
ncbi:hypothetical protein VNO78_19092 [Psophocarpus tetragonolobus]|uniref:Uncharacterized protein n=1 Tax=Psophocarpus tetragonolobus TaxID=3891 RepID=A0AAN9S7T8_PSOTE